METKLMGSERMLYANQHQSAYEAGCIFNLLHILNTFPLLESSKISRFLKLLIKKGGVI